MKNNNQNTEYKITSKSYKEPQKLKNWSDMIIYKSCRTSSKKNHKKIEFFSDENFENIYCVMEEKKSKEPFWEETCVTFLSKKWEEKQEEKPEQYRYFSVKIIIDEKFQTVYWYRDKNFQIPMQKEVLVKKGVQYNEEDKRLITNSHYDMEGNLIRPAECDKEIKFLAEFIAADLINKKNKYELVTQEALKLFKKNQFAKFIDTYNQKYTSIRDRVDALSNLQTVILEKEDWDCKKILKFRENLSKAKDKNFVFLFDSAMFQNGVISPEEFVQSVEQGIKKQIPMACAIKSFFYYYGLDFYKPSKEAIEKAILLEPNNLEYKKLLKELEQEKSLNDKRDM